MATSPLGQVKDLSRSFIAMTGDMTINLQRISKGATLLCATVAIRT
jgi:hypothetical protein